MAAVYYVLLVKLKGIREDIRVQGCQLLDRWRACQMSNNMDMIDMEPGGSLIKK